MTTAHHLYENGWTKLQIKQCLLALLAAFLIAPISLAHATNDHIPPQEWKRLFFGEQIPEKMDGTVYALNLASEPPNAIIRIGQNPILYVAAGDVVRSGLNVFTIEEISGTAKFL